MYIDRPSSPRRVRSVSPIRAISPHRAISPSWRTSRPHLHHRQPESTHALFQGPPQIPEEIHNLGTQLRSTQQAQMQLEQYVAQQESHRQGLEAVACSQHRAVGELTRELHLQQSQLESMRQSRQQEEASANRMARGVLQLNEQAQQECKARREAEQVLQGSVAGTLQWLEQMKSQIQVLQSQLGHTADSCLHNHVAFESKELSPAITAATQEAYQRLRSRAGFLNDIAHDKKQTSRPALRQLHNYVSDQSAHCRNGPWADGRSLSC